MARFTASPWGARSITAQTRTPEDRGSGNAFRTDLKRLLAKAVAEGITPRAIARHLAYSARHVKSWAAAKAGG